SEATRRADCRRETSERHPGHRWLQPPARGKERHLGPDAARASTRVSPMGGACEHWRRGSAGDGAERMARAQDRLRFLHVGERKGARRGAWNRAGRLSCRAETLGVLIDKEKTL